MQLGNSKLRGEDLKQILHREALAIESIPIGEEYNDAVELIVERVHRQGGKLITSGMGKAGQIAANIATTFASTGTPAFFLHPSEAQHGDLGIICPHDLLLLVSNSGKTTEVLELVRLAQQLVPDIPSICITGSLESPIADLAHVAIYTGGSPEICPLGLTPTVSTTCMTVIGDLLVVSTMTAIDFSYDDYAKRHNGGYLGSISRAKQRHLSEKRK
ncbi:MAG: SIS domain-containing protein [Porphyromonas sp.]|nr:SIS domain-containing protein [Porphyromonas sp.]